MSDTRFFNQQKELTEAERLDILERRMPVLQERIQRCDELAEEIRQLKTTITAQTNKLSAQEIENKALRGLIADSVKRMQSKIEPIMETVASHDNKFIHMATHLSSQKISLEAYGMQVQDAVHSIKDQITKAIAPYATQNQLQVHVAGNEVRLRAIDGALAAVKTKADYLETCNHNLSSLHEAHTKALDNVKLGLSNQINASVETQKTVVNKKEAKILQEIGQLKSDTAKSIEQLKGIVEVSPASLDKIRQEINDRLTNITLDASNANLKATNNAQKVVTIEKKLENLNLLVNKLELNK